MRSDYGMSDSNEFRTVMESVLDSFSVGSYINNVGIYSKLWKKVNV